MNELKLETYYIILRSMLLAALPLLPAVCTVVQDWAFQKAVPPPSCEQREHHLWKGISQKVHSMQAVEKTFWNTRNSESEWLITDQSDGVGIIAQPFSWCCEYHIMMPGYPDEHLLKRNCASFGWPHHHADLCRIRQLHMLVSIFLQLVYHRQELITHIDKRSILCSVAPKSAELSECSWNYITW